MKSTIGTRLIETGGRTTGFDYLRIGLAVGVVLWHTIPISYGSEASKEVMTGPWRALVAIILPAFFALSGFLVAGSLERNRSLFRFGSLRALRILPALGVEVVLSALILGPLLTTLPLSSYFAQKEFHLYFANVVGWIHYQLPGTFETNPYPNVVNGQLWTIPFELECYASLAFLAAVGVVRRRWLFLAAVLSATITLIVSDAALSGLADATGSLSGRLLVVAFLVGVMLHRFRAAIPYNWTLFSVALACAFVSLSVPLGDYAAPFFCAYVVAFLGLQNPKANILVKFGDLSYGVFLYGFAIQQLVASFGDWAHHWYISIALTLPIVSVFAAFSWYVVEKPALSLRRYLDVFDGLDRRIGALEASVVDRVTHSPLRAIGRLPLVSKLIQAT